MINAHDGKRADKQPRSFGSLCCAAFMVLALFSASCAGNPAPKVVNAPQVMAIRHIQNDTVQLGRYVAGTTKYHGGVSCEGNVPVIEFGGGEGLARAENVRHEAIHFVQLASDDCEDTVRDWNAHPLNWLNAEAEAFCIGIKVWPDSLRAPRQEAYWVMLCQRHKGYECNDAREALARYC